MKKKRKYVKFGKYSNVTSTSELVGKTITYKQDKAVIRNIDNPKEIACVNKEGRVFYKFTPNKLRGDNVKADNCHEREL